MAIISATSIIRSLSLFHLTISYYLITSPSTITDQNLVWIFGEAMGLPHPTSLMNRSGPTAFLGVVLALLGISDFTAASLSEEVSAFYWGSQAPVRLLFFFALTGYTYVFKSGGLGAAATSEADDHITGAGDELKNSVVFTWGFLEMMCWFWVFVTLRDERKEVMARVSRKREAEENRLR